ncbi:MAG: hypothetical protein V1253_07510, partial [Alphaproteobacteria bacterium]|nr:hypothetical protein [Alphaproteobacteria bacterium]
DVPRILRIIERPHLCISEGESGLLCPPWRGKVFDSRFLVLDGARRSQVEFRSNGRGGQVEMPLEIAISELQVSSDLGTSQVYIIE